MNRYDTDYTVEIRYPDVWLEPTIEDVKKAFKIAQKAKEFVLERLKGHHAASP